MECSLLLLCTHFFSCFYMQRLHSLLKALFPRMIKTTICHRSPNTKLVGSITGIDRRSTRNLLTNAALGMAHRKYCRTCHNTKTTHKCCVWCIEEPNRTIAIAIEKCLCRSQKNSSKADRELLNVQKEKKQKMSRYIRGNTTHSENRIDQLSDHRRRSRRRRRQMV